MGCNCGGNKGTQFEVVTSEGTVVFGPTPYKTTADAMSERHPGSRVREAQKDGA